MKTIIIPVLLFVAYFMLLHAVLYACVFAFGAVHGHGLCDMFASNIGTFFHCVASVGIAMVAGIGAHEDASGGE